MHVPHGQHGPALSWIGLIIFIAITAIYGFILYAGVQAGKEAMENIKRDHPEYTEQQLLEYMQDPSNKAEIEQYTEESVKTRFGI